MQTIVVQLDYGELIAVAVAAISIQWVTTALSKSMRLVEAAHTPTPVIVVCVGVCHLMLVSVYRTVKTVFFILKM